MVLWSVAFLSGRVEVGSLALLGALALIPASDVALNLVNHRVTSILHAATLPGLALRGGVPGELRTLVVVPTLLSSTDWVEELLDTLEVHFHANNDNETYFACLLYTSRCV